MKEWTDGSLLNYEAIDNLTEEQLDNILKILEKIK